MEQLVDRIKKIKERYKTKKIPLLGTIRAVSYSELGNCLILGLSGDVPMAMQQGEIVIVHPKSQKEGWVGIGRIGFNAYAQGAASIEKIPLCDEAISLLKEIYLFYTETECSERFFLQNDINTMSWGSTLRALQKR